MATVRLDNISKVYPNGHAALTGLDLDIADGEFLVLVGPSGCGKSTALRLVAGLEAPTCGRVFLDGRDVTTAPPQDRDLAMVCQSHALYPHLTVRENLEFGLRTRKAGRAVIVEQVQRAAQSLGLEDLLNRKPAQLSGGQRQRVALGRAIVREPQAFLLDEPLSNLDAQLRVQMRAELAQLHRRLRATMIYVTHDQEEAMTLGDRIAILRDGRLQQLAAPMEVYRRPANAFVAGFIGSPSMNFFPAALRHVEGEIRIESPAFSLSLPGGPDLLIRRDVLLGVRPQDVRPATSAAEEDVRARVDLVQPLGNDCLVHLTLDGTEKDATVTMVVPAERNLRANEELALHFRRDRLHLFDAGDGRRESSLDASIAR